MIGSHPIDGKLADWDEVKRGSSWEALLIGNGLSINVWPDFKYASLYEEAERGTELGGLTDQDKDLFAAFDTRNFEIVLTHLNSAIRAAEPLKQDTAAYYERYQTIQAALGAAVRSVHIDRAEAPDRTLEAIFNVIREHEIVFTTSYDLLTYWAMAYGDWERVCDCFWSHGRNEFDLANAEVWTGWTPVYFLHGALHLLVMGTGATRKLVWDDKALLDQFGQPIAGDPKARPLLVTEGSSQDKARAIDGNTYLSHALKQLRDHGFPIVVFGQGLGDQDQHLVDAINANHRTVAVSIQPGPELEVMKRQAETRRKLAAVKTLLFFNSKSHPLGSEDLTKKGSLLRRLKAGIARF